MARTFTVQELLDATRARADIQGDPHKPDTEVLTWISAAYAELYDILVSTGIGYFESVATFVSDGINSFFVLPSDFYALLRVDQKFDANTIWPVKEISVRSVHRVSTTGARSYYYRLAGANINMYPLGPAGLTYLVTYVPAPAKLTTVGQVIDGVSGWEEYIVVGAAIRGLLKAGEDVQALGMERQRLEARITQASLNRQIASATSLVQEDQDAQTDWDRDPADWRQY